MLIFDDYDNTIILESIYTPTPSEYFWTLDLQMMDFTLTELQVLEELISPSLTVSIFGFEFILPANWNILVADKETSQLDVVEVSNIPGGEFSAVVSGPDMSKVELLNITAVDYLPAYVNVSPSLSKHQMLCHPISPTRWINTAPSDTFNKFFKHATIGHLF